MRFSEEEKDTPKNQDPPRELVETDFSCGNCERPLLKTLRTKDIDHLVKVRVHCSECDDFSFTKEVSGAFFIAPATGVKIQDAKTSADNSLHTIYTKANDV
tara:strand:- start:7783 stop:8085 length:303 start_codon:yes stop_codon:yes gene_type:complete